MSKREIEDTVNTSIYTFNMTSYFPNNIRELQISENTHYYETPFVPLPIPNYSGLIPEDNKDIKNTDMEYDLFGTTNYNPNDLILNDTQFQTYTFDEQPTTSTTTQFNINSRYL